MILFTDNVTTTEVSNLTTDELIGSISLHAIAGQVSEDNGLFRIGIEPDPYSDDPYDGVVPVTIFTNDPALSISTDNIRGFSATLQQFIQPGKIGSSIFVKVTADLDAIEGNRIGHIYVNNEPFVVNYFIAEADKGETETSAYNRFAGDQTFEVLQQFDTQGEALQLIRYDPLPKPAQLSKGVVYPFQAIKNRNVVEWCNPNNSQVGYSQTTYHVKGFIGDQDLMQNLQYNLPLTLSHGDQSQILIPADFEGFDPKPIHVVEYFSQLTPHQKAYQRTCWTVMRNDGEYALINIRRQSYYRGQFLFYCADLQRVNYPGGDSLQGFLPWNQLYDEDGKVISYIVGFSRENIEDPYCESEYGEES